MRIGLDLRGDPYALYEMDREKRRTVLAYYQIEHETAENRPAGGSLGSASLRARAASYHGSGSMEAKMRLAAFQVA